MILAENSKILHVYVCKRCVHIKSDYGSIWPPSHTHMREYPCDLLTTAGWRSERVTRGSVSVLHLVLSDPTRKTHAHLNVKTPDHQHTRSVYIRASAHACALHPSYSWCVFFFSTHFLSTFARFLILLSLYFIKTNQRGFLF